MATSMRCALSAFLFAAWLVPAQAQHEHDPVPFKPSAAKPIERIALLGISPPQQVKVHNVNVAGMAFGVLPAMIYGADIVSKSREYVAQLNKRRGASLPQQLAWLLYGELLRKYHVIPLTQRPAYRRDNSADYSGIRVHADAILDVFYGELGYLSPSFEGDYRPLLHLGVRLVDADTYETLYYKQLVVHPTPSRLQKFFDAVESDTRYRYATFEALMADFERSHEGLARAQETLVQRIARDLQVPEKPVEPEPEAKPATAEPPSEPAGNPDRLSSPPPQETPNGDKK